MKMDKWAVRDFIRKLLSQAAHVSCRKCCDVEAAVNKKNINSKMEYFESWDRVLIVLQTFFIQFTSRERFNLARVRICHVFFL
jgi:hypothetical protein